MKKYILLLLSLFILITTSNIANANVDVTNAFWFTYKCENWVWILSADFNQWWHHHYYRYYNIDMPWTI
jgi:hypothetical protein